MKKQYEYPEVEILLLTNDVITTSEPVQPSEETDPDHLGDGPL